MKTKGFLCGLVGISLLLTGGFLPASLSHHGADSWAAADGFLGDRHGKAGMNCDSCHKADQSKTKVPMEVCLGCHGSYEKIAQQTEKSHRNPHESHNGEVACDHCHHGHKPSQDYCAQCHNFGFKVP